MRRFFGTGPNRSETREWIKAVISAGGDVESRSGLIELRRDGVDCERWNHAHFDIHEQRIPDVGRCPAANDGPVVAATD